MQRGVEVAVTHSLAGVTIGTLIEAFVLPKFDALNTMNQQLLEFVMQSALNGALATYVAPYLQEEDPTGGGIFFTTLYGAQPQWQQRVRYMSRLLKSRVSSLQDMAASAPQSL